MESLEAQADAVAQKVRHYLITTMGRTADEATDEEFYRAFSASLREEIMINWTATDHTLKKPGLRKLYIYRWNICQDASLAIISQTLVLST